MDGYCVYCTYCLNYISIHMDIYMANDKPFCCHRHRELWQQYPHNLKKIRINIPIIKTQSIDIPNNNCQNFSNNKSNVYF